jgi:2-dehydro-3-deoxyphosphogluconate aldolase/(4S)-4-hydroxy-2-oxoglutarate aldolase
MREKTTADREKEIIESILANKIIAIIRGVEESKISMVAEALFKGGIKLLEVTFNMSEPLCDHVMAKQIIRIKELLGGEIKIGAGTVTTTKQVDIACSAHADFIVSPNMDAAVVHHTKKAKLVSIPGAFTASEIVAAERAGADFIKVFPISACGDAYIKAIKAPLSEARLLAVGGVNEANIRQYLDAGCVGVGVGGQLVSKEKIEAGRVGEIEETARRLVACVKREKL